MNRLLLLRNASHCAANLLRSPVKPKPDRVYSLIAPVAELTWQPRFRLFSSETGNDPPAEESQENAPASAPEVDLVPSVKTEASIEVPDVNNKELKTRIEKYFKGDEEALLPILEAILQRRMNRKHEETDDELVDELQMQPLDDVKDEDFESDFEALHDTDEDVENLYDASEIVKKRMAADPNFNVDDTKWNEMIEEAVSHGYLMNTKECENVLEDMLSWDKLLPAKMKKEVEKKFNELGDRCEKGELNETEAFELFKQFEDEMLMKYAEKMEEGGPSKLDEAGPDTKHVIDDPPGEGPVLRWHTRAVFAPGGDAWHPKNRKVKMSVTVKELGLSKHQFRRLRELVGKRYHPGKDELTITSERFEHREENRKDCLRTLLSLIEESAKANKMVEDARASYVKDRLRANPAFMERLQAKTAKIKAALSTN